MEEIDPHPFEAHTIFCDDVRYEVGNKHTLAGIYAHTMFIRGEFPAIIPKFVFSIEYLQLHDETSFMPPKKIFIFLPGDLAEKPSITDEFAFDPAHFKKHKDDWRKQEWLEPEVRSGPGVNRVRKIVAVAPLVLQQPGLIKVRVVRGEKLV